MYQRSYQSALNLPPNYKGNAFEGEGLREEHRDMTKPERRCCEECEGCTGPYTPTEDTGDKHGDAERTERGAPCHEECNTATDNCRDEDKGENEGKKGLVSLLTRRDGSTFAIDDIILGGLIVLLLNNHADDELLLILVLLFISGI